MGRGAFVCCAWCACRSSVVTARLCPSPAASPCPWKGPPSSPRRLPAGRPWAPCWARRQRLKRDPYLF
ncbi:hypothetical protein M885DRAFT_543539, partial [Pelagophyceae sp. CCMP2097]